MGEQWTNQDYSATHNFLLLTWHCFKKGVQLGSVIGSTVVPPISYLRNYKTLDKAQIVSNVIKHQLVAMAVGAIFSLSMMLIKFFGFNNKAACLQDRVYRINKNEGQVRTDIFAGAGFVSSLGLGYLITGNIGKAVGISSFGITFSILAHVATKSKKIE